MEFSSASKASLYRPLRAEDHEIRLLKITGGGRFRRIACELHRYSLKDLPSYTALSYCWGDPTDTETIIVNGRHFPVTKNLEAALRQLEADGYSRLWIDAICINQNDPKERGHQVLYMRAIYSNANLVVVWLGSETGSSAAIMKYIARIDSLKAGIMKTIGLPSPKTEDDRKGDDSARHPLTRHNSERYRPKETLAQASYYNDIEYFLDRGLDSVFSFLNRTSRDGFRVFSKQPHWTSTDGIKEFFELPYWRRVWIIQEIVAASDITVYCGSRHVKMENIERLLVRTEEGKRLLRAGKVPNFNAFRASQNSGKRRNLVRLLVSSRASLATDPRDKVYALLGLSSDGYQLVPNPDYHQSLSSVFGDLTRSLLSAKRYANIILFRSPNRGPRDRLPSWIPDWTQLYAMNRPWHSRLAERDGEKAYLRHSDGKVLPVFPGSSELNLIESTYTIPRFNDMPKTSVPNDDPSKNPRPGKAWTISSNSSLSRTPSEAALSTMSSDTKVGYDNATDAPYSPYGPDARHATEEEVADKFNSTSLPRGDLNIILVRPPIRFEGHILQMKGYIIDTIDGLSTQLMDDDRMSDDEFNRRKLLQPHSRKSYYSKEDTAQALARAIAMEGVDFGDRIKSRKTKALGLTSASRLRPSLYIKAFAELLFLEKSQNSSVRSWLNANKRLRIGTKTLREWTRYADRIRVDTRTKDDDDWDDLFEKYLERVKLVVECGMRLITTELGRIGMGHPQAEDGDVICVLLGCTMPVILRRSRSRGLYNIVGEAYLHPIRPYTTNLMDPIKKGEYPLVDFAIE